MLVYNICWSKIGLSYSLKVVNMLKIGYRGLGLKLWIQTKMDNFFLVVLKLEDWKSKDNVQPVPMAANFKAAKNKVKFLEHVLLDIDNCIMSVENT